MKSFFSLKSAIQQIRDIIPFLGGSTISVEELYDILIEFTDLVRFARRESSGKFASERNPEVRSTTPSQNNPGGLIKIKYPQQVVPFSKDERALLENIQLSLVSAKDSLRNGTPIVGLETAIYFLPTIVKEIEIQSQNPTGENLSKKKKRARNRHFKYLRMKKN
jgi:hypothetical protein